MANWRMIQDFDNYLISDTGLVKNHTTGKILKQVSRKDGYLHVNLCNSHSVKAKSVHRLVAMAFVEGNAPSMQVNHKDGDKRNNHVDNLEWVTQKQNTVHAYNNGLIKIPKGIDRPCAKLTEESVRTIRLALSEQPNQKELATKFCVSPATISMIKSKKIWAHL